MSKINKILFLIISELLFLFFLFIILSTIFINQRPGTKQTSFENILPLDVNHTYIQPFTSSRDHLNSVSVLVKNPGLKSYDMVYIEIQNSKKETLRELSFSGRNIGDPDWLNFKFPVIDSKNKDTFFIKITSDAKKDNDLYIYGNKESQNINFKTTYKSSNLIESLKDNLNYQKNKISEINIFQTILYSIILITINILLIVSL